MQTETGSSWSAASTTTVVERAWIRQDPPLGAFVWGGLLPLLGLALVALFALLPFAHGDIEATVRRVTSDRLMAAGLDWVKTDVSGQDVDLRGTPPDSAAASEAVRIATNAVCPTWAGDEPCAVRVTPHFDAAAPAPAAAAAPPAAAAAAACEQDLAAIVAKSKIEFATSSAEITPQSAAVLDALARVARGCAAAGVLTVAGHTDSRGVAERNQALSLGRANAVRDALIARGLSPEHLKAQGFGADQPIASNDTESGRAENRRIEFHVALDSRP